MPKKNKSETQSEASDHARKKLLINPKFQLNFLGIVAFLIFVILVILYAANVYFFYKFQDLSARLHLAQDHIIYQFLEYQEQTMTQIYLGLSLSVIFVLATFGLVYSNRIAGPIHRMKSHFLRDARAGKRSPIRFRKKDFFQDLAQAYNQLEKKTENQ